MRSRVLIAIGVAEPTSISINTFGTGTVDDAAIAALVREHFDLRPKGLIAMLNLGRPHLPGPPAGLRPLRSGRRCLYLGAHGVAEALRAAR